MEWKASWSYLPVDYQTSNGSHEYNFWQSMLDSMFSFLTDVPEESRNQFILNERK